MSNYRQTLFRVELYSTVTSGPAWWLMPDNVNDGELENFLIALIPSNDVLWPLAQRYIESIPANEQPKNPRKAEVHAWLCW